MIVGRGEHAAVSDLAEKIGLRAVEGRAHVHDIHATILHLMGMDHEKPTYFHNARDERPTINGGEVITDIIA